MNKISKTEKIDLLRKLKEVDEKVAELFDVVCLICPYILDDPEGAAKSIVNDYNRLVRANISIVETKNSLLI